MAKVKPFKCTRPTEELAERVAALPYDVYNRKEAKEAACREELSFLNIDRPETQFGDDVDMYSPKVYAKAKELLENMCNKGVFITDNEECYYIYELTMNGRVQTGIVACSLVDDYLNGVIKKHENTRADKEVDRITHVDTCNAQTGPIFLAYRAVGEIDRIVDTEKNNNAIYDFVSDDGVRHKVWRISKKESIEAIRESFEKINNIYIADGHHRAASAVKVGLKRREANPGYTGEEEFNFFLSVLFPDNQLAIMDYNRVVKDLNGNTPKEFIDKVSQFFEIKLTEGQYKPKEKGTIGMFLKGSWYELKAKESIKSSDPIEGLDVSLLQKNILTPILGIKDIRTDKRIDFVGGIRGLSELERRCSHDMEAAFAMCPISISELFDAADANKIMPPKSTWFEPKLRSGLFIHKL